jgi:hypothetical protein
MQCVFLLTSPQQVVQAYKRRANALVAELVADAKVAADLALLSAATERKEYYYDNEPAPTTDAVEQGACDQNTYEAVHVTTKAHYAKADDDAPEAVEAAAWVPPSNQKGDGRTALNDKFGY